MCIERNPAKICVYDKRAKKAIAEVSVRMRIAQKHTQKTRKIDARTLTHTKTQATKKKEKDVMCLPTRKVHSMHTSAYVSIRQHTSAYVSIRERDLREEPREKPKRRERSGTGYHLQHAYVSIRQAYVSSSAYVSIRQHTSAKRNRLSPSNRIRQHAS